MSDHNAAPADADVMHHDNLPRRETVRINDIYPSIQGEGCQTGVPMVLVRLQGCGVGCPFCDTKETWADRLETTRREGLAAALGQNPYWCEADVDAVALFARMLAGKGIRWALITGGEPFDQRCHPLFVELRREGFRIAAETSGTAEVDAMPDWLTVSPKLEMPGGRKVLPGVVAMANEVKHVVGKEADVAKLDALLKLSNRIRQMNGITRPQEVCLQPMSQSAKATELCVKVALERGWRLSIQTHKVAGLR